MYQHRLGGSVPGSVSVKPGVVRNRVSVQLYGLNERLTELAPN